MQKFLYFGGGKEGEAQVSVCKGVKGLPSALFMGQ